MIAVDTNLLVRLLTEDDPGQARCAAKVMSSDEIFIPKTVILETEWVLRYAYGVTKANISVGFQKLLGLSNVTVEDMDQVTQAISWYDDNLDFADALHLASSMELKNFATFDKVFAKKARKVSQIHIIDP